MSLGARGACGLYYSYQVRDRSGKIIVPFRRRTAHSFVIAYARLLFLKMVAPVNQSITDTGSSSRTIWSFTGADVTIAAGTSTAGLVVGTGTNAVALADVALQTRIAHGTSAGTLDYGASTLAAVASDSTSTRLQLTRVFANSSGGTITVRELGVYAVMKDTGATSRNMCLVRDLATITLTNGDQLTLNYILQTTA